MTYTVENLEKSMAKVTITVEAAKFDEAVEKSFHKNRGKFQIPGFRRGKASRKMIEKTYGEGVFYEDAANFVIDEAYAEFYDENKAKKELEIASRPEIDLVDFGAGKDFVFTATMAVKPEVTLGDYKGVEVTKREAKIMAADVNAEIDRIREQNSRMITVEDRGIKKDDTAVIDFEGFVDGEAFEGGKGTDYPLVIGSGSFIDNFEDQLIGKKVGESLDVEVTFPEEYHAEELKGKPALFKVTIKEIKVKELPAADDEFASEVSEFETLKEYKASLKKDLTAKKTEANRREKENEAVEKVVENMTVEIPAPMMEAETQQMIQEFAQNLQMQGISIDQYMQMTGMNPQALMSQMQPQAEQRIKTRLALEAVAKAENIEVTDADIDAEIEEMAKQYNMEADKIKETLGDAGKEQLSADIANKKAVALITDSAKEVEKAEEETKEAE